MPGGVCAPVVAGATSSAASTTRPIRNRVGRFAMTWRTALTAWLLWHDAEQPTRIGVLEHPEGAVRTDFHIANPVPDTPALGGRRAALAIERNAIERLCRH